MLKDICKEMVPKAVLGQKTSPRKCNGKGPTAALSWGRGIVHDAVLFGSPYHQLYRYWSSIANAQHLKELMAAATRPLGAELSHALEMHGVPPITVREMQHPY